MTPDKDIDLLIKWACLNRPGGRLAWVASDPGTAASVDINPTFPVETMPFKKLLAGGVRAKPWQGLYLLADKATLTSHPSLPTALHAAVDGPVLIRLSSGAEGLREAWDERFINAGWLRHPLILTAAEFVSLETEETFLLLGYLPLRKAVSNSYPLEKLRPERNLHMDMLREAGRRADAHLARYTWALDFIRPNDRVVDAACGLGYGSAMLRAGTACEVISGLDASTSAIAYAQGVYGAAWKSLDFRVCNLADLSGLADDSIDCLVSFETFEHLADPQKFADQILRVLKPGGRLLCSVPNRWVDESGKDPSPHHLQTFDLPLLMKICRKFRAESLVGQCAGGTDPRFGPARRFERFDGPPAEGDARAAGIEWWVLAAMKDPLKPAQAQYQETVFPALLKNPAKAPYAQGYRNPWIVHALVHFPFRLKTPAALQAAARELAAATPPGSADHGAALAVLAYQVLSLPPRTEARAYDEIAGAIRKHLAVAADAPHEHRWRISLSFALAQILLAGKHTAQAQRAFEACAALDFRQFAPHIATKTTDAAFKAGQLALYAGDFAEAKRWFQRGLDIGRDLNQVPLDEILIDPQRPHLHGLGDGMREYILALDCVSRCANGLGVIDQYERLGRADISAIERSWQWEVTHLAEELRLTVADSNQRLEQIHSLTLALAEGEKGAVSLRAQAVELTGLARHHEAEGRARLAQVKTLTAGLKAAQADAPVRLEQVRQLTVLVKQHETESANRATQIATLTANLKALRTDADARLGQVKHLTALVKQHEVESADRLQQVERLTASAKLSASIHLKVAEKDAALLAADARATELGRMVQDRETRLAKLDADVRTLNHLIHSGDLTAPLQAALQRAQQETTLANHLLTATLDLRRDTRQWLPVPLPDFTGEPPKLLWNLEAAHRGINLTRVFGWACPEIEDAARCGAPCLLAIGANAAWVQPGLMVERPDVLAAFPAAGEAARSRLQSGFVFELSSAQLPDNIRAWRILLGMVNRPPVVTPEFQLT